VRLGIVSDIHGQHHALQAALTAMGSIDGLLCLGDSINQAQFSNRTVALLRNLDAVTIVGNHEEVFFAGSGRSGAGVDAELADWLAARPAQLEVSLNDKRLLLVHSTPWPSMHAYVSPTHRDFGRFGEVHADLVLYGHTHRPLIRQIGSVLVVNPGSVGEGRPADHGFVRSCAVLDLASLAAEIIDLD